MEEQTKNVFLPFYGLPSIILANKDEGQYLSGGRWEGAEGYHTVLSALRVRSDTLPLEDLTNDPKGTTLPWESYTQSLNALHRKPYFSRGGRAGRTFTAPAWLTTPPMV